MTARRRTPPAAPEPAPAPRARRTRATAPPPPERAVKSWTLNEAIQLVRDGYSPEHTADRTGHPLPALAPYARRR